MRDERGIASLSVSIERVQMFREYSLPEVLHIVVLFISIPSKNVTIPTTPSLVLHRTDIDRAALGANVGGRRRTLSRFPRYGGV